jgi:hypothetical protein
MWFKFYIAKAEKFGIPIRPRFKKTYYFRLGAETPLFHSKNVSPKRIILGGQIE